MRSRPRPRFSLAVLMGFIGVLAVGLGLMRNGSRPASRITLGVVPVVLLVGLLGALVRRGEGSWVGFALLGWIYALLAFAYPLEAGCGRRINPISDLVDQLVNGLHPGPGPAPAAPVFNAQFQGMLGDRRNLQHVRQGGGMDPPLLDLLTAAEKTASKGYQDPSDSYNRGPYLLAGRQANAKVIGHAQFALFGSILGRAPERPLRSGPDRGAPRPAEDGES